MTFRIPSLFLLLALGACAELDRGEPLREVVDTVDGVDTADGQGDTGPGDATDDTAGDTAAPLSFAAGVHELLLDNCTDSGCHGSGAGGYTLSGEIDADYQATLNEVVPGDGEGSRLVKKATATSSHGGGPILQTDTPEYQLLVDWIDGGANP